MVRWKNRSPTYLTTEVTEDTEGSCPLVHHPLDPVLEPSRVKIDQETRPVATQLEVRQKLGFVYGSQLTHRLQLHDHRVFNDEIDSVPRSILVSSYSTGSSTSVSTLKPRLRSSYARHA